MGVWNQDFAPSFFLYLIDHVTSRTSHTHSFHLITFDDISIGIHEISITFGKLLLPTVIFTFRSHRPILSPGFVVASGPFLTETDASPVTWRWASTNKNTDSFRWKPHGNPPGCAKGMPEHSEIRGPPNPTSNVQWEEFGRLWCYTWFMSVRWISTFWWFQNSRMVLSYPCITKSSRIPNSSEYFRNIFLWKKHDHPPS